MTLCNSGSRLSGLVLVTKVEKAGRGSYKYQEVCQLDEKINK